LPSERIEIKGTALCGPAFPLKKVEHPMDRDRVPVIVFAALFAVIGVIAASSVLITERNDGVQQTTVPRPR
jgi:hypothetical protein